MIKSAFCYVFGLDNLREKILRVKAEGDFDGIEFWHNIVRDADKDRLREYCDEAGLAIAQVCPYFDFTAGPAECDRTLELGRAYIQIAQTLGNPLIRVFTGHVKDTDATPEQWQAAFSGLQTLCDEAADFGVRFCLEIGHGLMFSSASVLRLLEGVDRPNLGVNIQVLLEGEDLWYTLEQLGPYAIHMHAHNWVGRLGGHELTFLGSGLLDYEEFLTKLLGHGYDGYISSEHVDHYAKHDPWVTAAVDGRTLAALKKKLNG
ncbi:MAG TPA: sugar phosphate isomerase/epimerase family protein [Armatimonadota bacterium]|jgi:sugar phosphate isomerase/epimerase